MLFWNDLDIDPDLAPLGKLDAPRRGMEDNLIKSSDKKILDPHDDHASPGPGQRPIHPLDHRLYLNANDIARRTLSFQRIVAPICHELNNNMAVIRLNMTRVRTRAADLPPDSAAALMNAIEAMRASCRFITRLQDINETLSFPQQAVMDANLVLANLLEQERLALGQRPPGSLSPFPFVQIAAPMVVTGSASLFSQSLRALIKNSMDAGAKPCRISVSLRRESNRDGIPCAAVSVMDDGMGMTLEVMARAVDPFFTTKNIAVAQGLGLSEVCAFVRQARGSLLIISTPGEGTCVKMSLPLVIPHEDSTSTFNS